MPRQNNEEIQEKLKKLFQTFSCSFLKSVSLKNIYYTIILFVAESRVVKRYHCAINENCIVRHTTSSQQFRQWRKNRLITYRNHQPNITHTRRCSHNLWAPLTIPKLMNFRIWFNTTSQVITTIVVDIFEKCSSRRIFKREFWATVNAMIDLKFWDNLLSFKRWDVMIWTYGCFQ